MISAKNCDCLSRVAVAVPLTVPVTVTVVATVTLTDDVRL